MQANERAGPQRCTLGRNAKRFIPRANKVILRSEVKTLAKVRLL